MGSRQGTQASVFVISSPGDAYSHPCLVHAAAWGKVCCLVVFQCCMGDKQLSKTSKANLASSSPSQLHKNSRSYNFHELLWGWGSFQQYQFKMQKSALNWHMILGNHLILMVLGLLRLCFTLQSGLFTLWFRIFSMAVPMFSDLFAAVSHIQRNKVSAGRKCQIVLES